MEALATSANHALPASTTFNRNRRQSKIHWMSWITGIHQLHNADHADVAGEIPHRLARKIYFHRPSRDQLPDGQ